jgi:hypothetical protein
VERGILSSAPTLGLRVRVRGANEGVLADIGGLELGSVTARQVVVGPKRCIALAVLSSPTPGDQLQRFGGVLRRRSTEGYAVRFTGS